MADVPLVREVSRVRRLARALIANHGRMAEIVALATVSALVEGGQLEYAELWQQVASAVSAMLGGVTS
jgi:hypothetical protein